MYLIPLLVIIVLALIAMAWGSPIFAVAIFAILFVLYLGYVGLSRRADQQATTPEARAAERGRQEAAEKAETRIR
jgi:positive regulator of sigma E activity